MITTFLNIPVNFKDIKQKVDVPRISVNNSIHNMIHLIVTTAYGEMRHNQSFGCDIWKFDFENIYNLPSFKEELKKSLRNSIMNNEKRLVNINIDLQIEQVEVPVKFRNKRIKIRILFVVTGVIEKTNEEFTHQDKFYIGPLSYS
jgi:phage baseplate assembly protein W